MKKIYLILQGSTNKLNIYIDINIVLIYVLIIYYSLFVKNPNPFIIHKKIKFEKKLV